MLGDAAGLGIDYVGAADTIEERCFAVINVSEDRHNGRPGYEVSFRFFGHDLLDHYPFFWSSIFVGRLFRLFILHDRPENFDSEFFTHDGGRIVIESLVDGRHYAELHKHFNEIDWTAIHSFGQCADGNKLLHYDGSRQPSGFTVGGVVSRAAILNLHRILRCGCHFGLPFIYRFRFPTLHAAMQLKTDSENIPLSSEKRKLRGVYAPSCVHLLKLHTGFWLGWNACTGVCGGGQKRGAKRR